MEDRQFTANKTPLLSVWIIIQYNTSKAIITGKSSNKTIFWLAFLNIQDCGYEAQHQLVSHTAAQPLEPAASVNSAISASSWKNDLAINSSKKHDQTDKSSLISNVILIWENGYLYPEIARESLLENIHPTGIILVAKANKPSRDWISFNKAFLFLKTATIKYFIHCIFSEGSLNSIHSV